MVLGSFFYGYIFTQIPGGYLAGKFVLIIAVSGNEVIDYSCKNTFSKKIIKTLTQKVVLGRYAHLNCMFYCLYNYDF